MSLKANILIVDDNPEARKTLADILTAKGYTPLVVATGQAALAKVEQMLPAVALIDLKLEDMSGLAVLEGIKNCAPDTECILLTGYASQASAIQAINLGAFSYLQKPHDMEQLLVTVRRAIEEQETRAELKQRAAQLVILNEIGRQIAMVLELDKVLERAVHLVQKSFGYHHVALFTLNQAQDELVMKAKAGDLTNHFPPEHRIKLGEGINGWVGQHGQRLLANDVSIEPRYVNFFPESIATQSELSVPIQIGQGVVGVLDVQSPQLNAFAQNDVLVIETLANQIAVAIENARLYGEVQRELAERKRAETETQNRNRELTLLNRIIAASAAKLEPAAILETACRELALAFDIPQVAAALLDRRKEAAQVAAEYLIEGQSSSLHQTMPVAASPIYRHLLIHKAPLVVDEAQSTPHPDLSRELRDEWGNSSMLIAPLVIEDEVIGSLCLESLEHRAFSAEEISLAWKAADQVAQALAQVRLAEAHQRLAEQYHQAQKMDMVGRLTSGIAHDFNNLLTAVTGFAELAQMRSSLDDSGQKLVEKILQSSRRASDLVGQLMAFSRKQIIEPKILNLNNVVTEIDTMLRRIIGEDIHMETELMPDLWPVKADPSQIEQVIVNLAVNARDAMPRGGNLIIETANLNSNPLASETHPGVQPGHYVLLSVSDTGVGMSKEVQARVFEPFFTTKEKGKGTGLGLSTVFGIVEQNRGHILVSSEMGRGSTFKVYLPKTSDVIPPPDHSDQAGAKLSPGTETILLAEDEPAVREMSAHVLHQYGYTVLEAENGQDALQLAQEYGAEIHLLLTDVVMPRLSGPVLAERIRARRPHTKVLFTSGYAGDRFVRQGILKPGINFIAKPFSPLGLVRKVRETLDKQTEQ
jgi:signal transduction histidine kinase/DNA-binding response OmpR family regulator